MVSSIHTPLCSSAEPPVVPLDFQVVMQQQRPHLKQYAERRMSSQLRVRADASDVVQETCLRAFRELDQFLGQSREQFLAWLYRIHDRNVCRHVERHITTRKRDANREVRAEPDSTAQSPPGFVANVSSPSARLQRTELAEILHSLLQQLSPQHRTVLRLRVAEGLSFDDIGIHMARSSGAVRKLYSRARQELTQLFHQREGQ